MENILLACAIALIVLNVFATYRCINDSLATRGQRTALIVCSWLVPIIGALMAITITRNSPERSTGKYPEERVTGGDDIYFDTTRSSDHENDHFSGGDFSDD